LQKELKCWGRRVSERLERRKSQGVMQKKRGRDKGDYPSEKNDVSL
jgi:hypothetical protein